MSAPTQEQTSKIREIIEHLDQLPAAEMENRRKAPRVPMQMSIRITLLSGTAPTAVEIFTRNISPAGFGFVSRRMFRREERLALLLRFPKLPPKLIHARITFGRYVRNGMHEMGAEFLECITDPKNPEQIPPLWLAAAQQAKPAQE